MGDQSALHVAATAVAASIAAHLGVTGRHARAIVWGCPPDLVEAARLQVCSVLSLTLWPDRMLCGPRTWRPIRPPVDLGTMLWDSPCQGYFASLGQTLLEPRWNHTFPTRALEGRRGARSYPRGHRRSEVVDLVTATPTTGPQLQ